MDNCEKCQGDKNKDECTLCKDNYIPKYDENNLIKSCNEKCNTNNKCKECDLNNNECIKCDKGYFIPSDDEVKFMMNAVYVRMAMKVNMIIILILLKHVN